MKKLRCNPNDRVTPFFLLERGKEMGEKKKMLLADFALLLAATFWGMGFVAGDMAAKAFPTFWIMTVRFLGAGEVRIAIFRQASWPSTSASGLRSA